MVRQIQKMGVEAVPSYTILPEGKVQNSDTAHAAFRAAGADGVVVIRGVHNTNEQYYQPGGWTYSSFPVYYRSFWGFYGQAWPMIYQPGYVETNRVTSMEVLVYDLRAGKDGGLVWSGLTRTQNAGSPENLIQGVAQVVSQDMEKKGLLKKPVKT